MAGEMNTDVVSMLFKNAVSVGEDDGSDDMAQAEFVIQCSGCLHVLSDSTMVGSTEEQLAVIAVKRVTDNVTEDRKITISQSGLDEASCFRYLRCKKCTTVLGKRYRTTTVELDHIRDHYCLYVDEIDCYEVGSLQEDSDGLKDQGVPNQKTMYEYICKLQNVVITLSERIKELEKQQQHIKKNTVKLVNSPRKQLKTSVKKSPPRVYMDSDSDTDASTDRNSTIHIPRTPQRQISSLKRKRSNKGKQ